MKGKMHSLIYEYSNNILGTILILLHLAKVIMDILYLSKEHFTSGILHSEVNIHQTQSANFHKRNTRRFKTIDQQKSAGGCFQYPLSPTDKSSRKKNQSEKCWS